MDIEIAQRKIDVEIDLYMKSIQCLKARRNAIALISRLPPEILSAIFLLTVSMDNVDWVKVSHVCSHWRRVALDCPNLWSTICLRYLRGSKLPKWSEEMLIRSKMAPLTLLIEGTGPTIAMLMLKNMSRIRDLTIRSDTGQLEVVKRLAESPAPLLERLRILSLPRYVPLTALFSGICPRLRELDLCDVDFTWNFPVLNHLTSVKFESTGSLPLHKFMSALKNVPNLEHLDISINANSYYPEPEAQTPPTSQDIVRLTFLSSIKLSSTFSDCVYILKHIVYPPTASTEVRSRDVPASFDFAATFGILSNADGHPGAHQPTLRLGLSPTIDGLLLQAWNMPATSYDSPSRPPWLTLSLQMERPGGASWGKENKEAFWDVLPLEELESLQITNSAQFGEHMWSTISSRLEKLISLHIDPPETNLVTLLSTNKLPALRELSIFNWNLGVYSESPSQVTYFQGLKSSLEDRNKRGIHIQCLYLYSCPYVTESRIKELEEVVEDVTWDGVEIDSEPDDPDYEDEYEYESDLDDEGSFASEVYW